MESTGADDTIVDSDITPASKQDKNFDWRNCWYPVSFMQDLPRDRPTSFSLYDTALVIFFDEDGEPNCFRDLCPHRAARLSDGRVIEGRLECLYHGWQFGKQGECVHIPQLPEGRQKPARSRAQVYPVAKWQEILWIWGGDADKADQALLPAAPTDKADSNDLFDVQFQMDLPYDQSYLIENIIDVAHIHIAHDGVRGGGKREAAKPLEFNLLESSIDGIKSTFRSMGLKRSNESPDIKGAQVQFVAPNLIRYASDYNQSDLIAGLDLYSIPLGKGRCRLLYRKYSNFTSWRERIKPRWVEHLTQCLILEQDMAVVIGQSEEIELADKELRDLWLPIKTSDRLVIEYRKWLDRFGGDMPFYQGFSTSKSGSQSREVKTDDRHALHTEICQSCSKLYSQLNIAIKASMAVAVGAFSLAVLNAASGNGGVFIAILLVSLGVIWLLTRLKSKL